MPKNALMSYVVRELDKARGTWPEIARLTGVSIRTVEKIGAGLTKNPTERNRDRLVRYFRRRDAARKAAATRRSNASINASL